MAGDGPKRAQSTLLQTALAILVVSGVSGIAGGFVGFSFLTLKETGPGAANGESVAGAHDAGVHGAHDKGHEPAPQPAAALLVKELPPIVTNLARPAGSWVRLQSAIVYDPSELQQVEPLVVTLMSDITAFLGTLELSNVEGPDGLRRLREELSDRAATRSERKLREFVIQTFVIQ